MEYDQKLYLSAMHPRKGGVVARVYLNNPTEAQLIGFPGSSVNAIAESNMKLMVVSGFKGTYGTVSPDQPATEYDYDNPDNNAHLGLGQPMDKNFGGKYVAVDESGNAYILRQNGENNGEIIDVRNPNNPIPMSVSLLSNEKFAEDYNPEAEGDDKWTVEGTRKSVFFGKHVMVIRKGIAYVAAGKNGIWKYDLKNNGKETKINGIFATGLYADNEFLYAATGSGLRIYKFNDETGDLPLYAFEVETYDEEGTGAPTSTTAATTGANAEKRHSPNFVTAHKNGDDTYIYIAYGQSGVRVYKFVKEGEEQPEDDHPWVDLDPESPIVWATENVEGYYAWGEIFHADSRDNTLEQFDADENGLQFTREINGESITVTNDAGYWANGISTSKTEYTWDNYKYFDGSTAKLTKYTYDDKEGNTNGPTVLEPQDDVATMRWGNGWRMPTIEEWLQLYQNASSLEEQETEDENGNKIKGYVFTFKNGKTLFLPPTGFYNFNGAQETDITGEWTKPNEYYYWSSSLSDQIQGTYGHRDEVGDFIWIGEGANQQVGWSFEALAYIPDFAYLWLGTLYANGYPRAQGMKVRPVKDKKNMPEDFPDEGWALFFVRSYRA